MKIRVLLLPTGYAVLCEIARSRVELERGLMDRSSLLPCFGMFFIHPREGVYRYWMKGVLIPLDLVWLDSDMRVTEIVTNAVPGSVELLGGAMPSRFVLEIPAGQVARYRLAPGQVLEFV